jgi:CMP-N-acetylneuraminic acid synthetase
LIYYVIPARKGSKGAPGKNRVLFDYTAETLSAVNLLSVIVSTDDDIIKDKAKERGFVVHNRADQLSDDFASMKDVLMDIAYNFGMHEEDEIVLLYLTYPKRTYQDIRDAIDEFHSVDNESLLCKKEVKTHPYLCINKNGTQFIQHNLYRRQDYPVVFEISHFVAMTTIEELPKLRNNLYNDSTYWHMIDDTIDVDTVEQLRDFNNE